MSMASWRECKLGDVITLKRGYDLAHQHRSPGSFPVVSSSGVTDYHAEYKVKGPGVVTGRYGTLGEVFYIKEDFWPLNTSLYVQDFKGNDQLFISYFMRQLDFGTQNAAGAVPGVNRNHLHAMDVRVPPLHVQRRIAGILSAYDELIENSQRRIRLLEDMASALYREWFVHFRFPGHDSVPRLPSALRDIPQGWKLGCYGEAAEFENGDRGKNYPNGGDFVDNGIPFINAGHLVNGAIDLAQVSRITDEKFEQLRSGKIRQGDLLFCLRGSPGRSARVVRLHQGAIASSLVIIRPTAQANKEYLFHTLSSEIGRQMVADLNNGAAQPNVSVGSIQKYPILLPSKDVLNQFAARVDQNWNLIDTLRAQVSILTAQRDLLLPRLLSGQVALPQTAGIDS